MPTNYTPLTNGQDAIAATFNAPLTELDDAIENLVDGGKALTSPTISSFTNATHNHQNAAGGGTLTASAINSGAATNGQVLTANGSGAAAWQTFAGVRVGMIFDYAGGSLPSGYLYCNGAAVSRVTYAALFAVIGEAYGVGDGSTTFNLPDTRGRVLADRDNSGGSSANRVTDAQADANGGAMGAETHTLLIGEIPAHNHGGGAALLGAGALQFAGGGALASTALTSQGGGGAHNNMQPTMFINKIIYAGV